MPEFLSPAGLDAEGRPIIVVNTALPLLDGQQVVGGQHPLSLEDTIQYGVKLLEGMVEDKDFVVIWIATPLPATTQLTPPLSTLYRFYRTMDQGCRKQCQALYVVHPTLWTRRLINFFFLFISPKFRRKIAYCETLSTLNALVPLSQLPLPEAIFAYNDQMEQRERPPSMSTRQFGQDLTSLMGQNGERGLPGVVTLCIDHLVLHGTTVEGVMRKSPSNAQLKLAVTVCDQGKVPELTPDTTGCILAGSLLKHFLRSIPGGVLPASLEHTEAALLKLPRCQMVLLVHLMQLLTELIDSPRTLMSIDAMAKVIGPNLVAVDAVDRRQSRMSDDASSTSSLSDEMKRVSSGVSLANWLLSEWKRGTLPAALQTYLGETET